MRRAGSAAGVCRVLTAFLALLLLPTLAVLRWRAAFDVRALGGYAFLVSLVTGLLYRHDKKQAQVGGWRTPESTLHLAEILGGWPGAFLAQRFLRHKNAKVTYQLSFWAIVLGYQLVAFDIVCDGLYSRAAIQYCLERLK